MTRFRILTVFAAAIFASCTALADDKKWAAIKGQIVVAAAPEKKEINVTADKEHCLSKGALVSDELIVNAKNKGVKNVWVYLRPLEKLDKDGKDTWVPFAENEIHANLAKPASKEHVIDQPCCAFVPRILAAREGDTLLVKNSSPVPHKTSGLRSGC